MAKVQAEKHRDHGYTGMRGMTGNSGMRRALDNILRGGLVAVMIGALGGCGGEDISDLRQYVRAEKAKPPSRLAPVPEFRTYEIFQYTAYEFRDPFKRFVEESEIVAIPDSGIPGPDLTRHRETLENFPLDTLRFVGHLEREADKWAIITAPDGVVHRVKAGNYVGTNFGKIVLVTETRLEIDEVVPDGRGGWIEREAALSLIE